MNIMQSLKTYFGYDRFRPGQEEIIRSVLDKKDTIALLPTGTGKSLCYQLPAYVQEGTVLVISPLISLMQDQIEGLRMNGEKRAVALNSFLDPQTRRSILESLPSYRFIYVSPEILGWDYLVEQLKKVHISLFVIDEAHCISQWGHDFRPDYLNLGKIRRELGNPTALALTATASADVRKDIASQLLLEEPAEFIFSVDRPNISLIVEEVTHQQEKKQRLAELVNYLQKPGIVYFSSKKMAEEMAEFLQQNGVEGVSAYHGGMDQEQRILIQQQYLYGQLQVICATSAFGMGINKNDIRFVIHFHLPAQAESYIQEIGRAGRDQKPSTAILLYCRGDEQLPAQFLEYELPDNRQILNYFEQREKLAKSDLMEALGLTDVQFRFLEHYGANSEGHEDPVQYAIDVKDRRMRHKWLKLNEMKQWILAQGCRREGMLALFGEQPAGNNGKCCDRCGISLDAYRQENSQAVAQAGCSWEKTLEKLLLPGGRL